MGRGRRQPDNVGLAIDHMLDASIRKKKFELLNEIKENFHFQELIQIAHGATREDNERLAHAILEARWNDMPVTPAIEKYAKLYIYPYRRRSQ